MLFIYVLILFFRLNVHPLASNKNNGLIYDLFNEPCPMQPIVGA